MVNQKKFFHDYFDGQIIKEESDKYKMFKLMLISLVSLFGLFCTLAKFSSPAVLLLLVLGMVWNFYIKLDSKLSVIFCILVSSIYFVLACNFRFYANALIYIGFYIPFQMFATTKTYYGGTFVQIKKELNDKNQILVVVFSIFLAVVLYMFDLGLGARFSILDAAAAGCLVVSALLRNERYNAYYYYRSIGLILSVILWVVGAVEYQNFELVMVAVMYMSYLVFDVVTNMVQKCTYENEYMLICKEYEAMEKEKAAQAKLKLYKKSK